MAEVVKDYILMLFGYQWFGILLSQIIVNWQVFGCLLQALFSPGMGQHAALELMLQGYGPVVKIDKLKILIVIEALIILHLYIIHKVVINVRTFLDSNWKIFTNQTEIILNYIY